ncbi:MAG: electron transport complex subunit RsxA [Planctomycetes bacterium]|nr:electron transport complex subunit RsxA [Planctomycetota bacterium]
MADYLLIAIGVIFVNNFILARFLGLCPFIGVTQKMDSAFGMGMAVTFVMTMASAITFPLYLVMLWLGKHLAGAGQPPVKVEMALRTVVFVLVIASFVQLVEIVLRKTLPALYRALGIFLPLITTNCAVMGVALLNTTNSGQILDVLNMSRTGDHVLTSLTFFQAVFQGFCAGIGFTIAMLLMAGIRERLARSRIPKSLQGEPIAFISTGLMALAFMGFQGMV